MLFSVDPICCFHKLALKKKDEGNEAFKQKDYAKAIGCYTDAIQLTDENAHLYYSNRSAAFVEMKEFDLALRDAQKCIDLEPTWPKVGSLVLGFVIISS